MPTFIIYILASAWLIKNSIELMMWIMLECIEPAVAGSFAVKLEANLPANDVVCFHL
jgi:hypothetical protein